MPNDFELVISLLIIALGSFIAGYACVGIQLEKAKKQRDEALRMVYKMSMVKNRNSEIKYAGVDHRMTREEKLAQNRAKENDKETKAFHKEFRKRIADLGKGKNEK